MSSSYIPIFLRKLVIKRAENRCEYCRLSQDGQEATFPVDHIIPLASDGQTVTENLALACVSCSLRKGAKQKTFDPHTAKEVKIFNPRADVWSDQFEWNGVRVKGRTSTGRATVEMLNLNRKLVLAIRREELLAGRSF